MRRNDEIDEEVCTGEDLGLRHPTVRMRGGGVAIIGSSWGGETATALALTPDGARFAINVLDRIDAPILSLGPFDEDEVVAIWRSLSARSGLPLAVSQSSGQIEWPFPQLGRLRIGAVQRRRRTPSLSGRRPRFLVRRKSARLSVRPLVYRECEMAAGGGR